MLKTGQADVIDISRVVLPEVKRAGFTVFNSIGKKMLFLVPHGWPQDPKATLNDVRVREGPVHVDQQEGDQGTFIMRGEAAVTGSWSYFRRRQTSAIPVRSPKQQVGFCARPATTRVNWRLLSKSPRRLAYPRRRTLAWPSPADWERIGVKVKVIAEDFGTLRPRLVKRTAAVPSLRLHAVGVAPLVLSLNLRNFFGCPEGNVWGMCDLEVDELRKGLEAATSAQQFDKLQKEARKALVDRFMFDPLLAYSDTLAAKDKVTDWDMGRTLYSLNFRYLALKGMLK